MDLGRKLTINQKNYSVNCKLNIGDRMNTYVKDDFTFSKCLAWTTSTTTTYCVRM